MKILKTLSIIVMLMCNYIKADVFDEKEEANPFNKNQMAIALGGNDVTNPFEENQAITVSAARLILCNLVALQNENGKKQELEEAKANALNYLQQQNVLIRGKKLKVIIPKDSDIANLLRYIISQKILTNFEKSIYIGEQHELDFLLQLMDKDINPFETVVLYVDLRNLIKNLTIIEHNGNRHLVNFCNLLSNDQSIKKLVWVSDFEQISAHSMEYLAQPLKTNKNLKELYLGFGGGTDIAPLGECLTYNHSLEKLCVEGTISSQPLDITPLFVGPEMQRLLNNLDLLALKGNISIDPERKRYINYAYLPKSFYLAGVPKEIFINFCLPIGASENIETFIFSCRGEFDVKDCEYLAKAIWANGNNDHRLQHVQYVGNPISETEVLKRARIHNKNIKTLIMGSFYSEYLLIPGIFRSKFNFEMEHM